MSNLHFVHISDTHLLHPGQQKDFEGIDPALARYTEQLRALPYTTALATEVLVREINALPVAIDFVLHTGDVTGEDSTDYAFTAGLLAQLPCPQVYLPGNHDLLPGLEQWLCHRETGPVCEYQFNGLQIVCLDSNRYGADHGGWLNNLQLDQLRRICRSDDDRPLIVALHHHPIAVDVAWLDALGLRNGAAMHEVLLAARHRLRGVFFGHIHHSVDIIKDGILYSGVASAAYQFAAWPGQVEAALDLAADPGFSLVTVTPEHTFVRHHRYRIPLPITDDLS